MREIGWSLNPCFQRIGENFHLLTDEQCKIHLCGGQGCGECAVIFRTFCSKFFHRTQNGNPAATGCLSQLANRRQHRCRVGVVTFVNEMAGAVANQGLGILLTYLKFIVCFYLALVTLWLLLVAVGHFFLGRRVYSLLHEIKEAFFLSFATASSEAAYPKILDALDRFGVSRKISSFVMPLGYSFNLDGSMMYCAFAAIFIAQVYGIEMTLGTQIAMLLTLMVTSKGMAGIPSASLVVIAGTLAQFGLPVEGMVLILGIDRFLDMGRSATNAVGNSIASAVIGKWEGELLSEEDAAKRRGALGPDA